MANGTAATLFTTRAHVFQVNPTTKNSWITKDDKPMPISFITSIANNNEDEDPSERELKIVGVNESGKLLLDSMIAPKTVFTKRSAKFGQWTDPTGSVYGLGFESEADLVDFMDTFQQLQTRILSSPSQDLHHQQPLQQHQSHQNNSALTSSSQSQTVALGERTGLNQQSMNNISETNGRFSTGSNGILSRAQEYSNTLAHPGDQQLRRKRNGNTSLTNGNSDVNGDTNSDGYPRSQSMHGIQPKSNSGTAPEWAQDARNLSRLSQSDWQQNDVTNVDQLKYENERLKETLEKITVTVDRLNQEVTNLRINNLKLTEAMQESNVHVVEWERELLNLREDNKYLKLQVKALETNDPEKNNEYKKELQQYKSYMDEVQNELRRKEAEISDLQKSMQDMELKSKMSKNDQQGDQSPQSSQRKQELEVISAKLESKIKSLDDIGKEFKLLVQSLGS